LETNADGRETGTAKSAWRANRGKSLGAGGKGGKVGEKIKANGRPNGCRRE